MVDVLLVTTTMMNGLKPHEIRIGDAEDDKRLLSENENCVLLN